MILPSIDLRGGRAVQLKQGRELLLTDPRPPVELARELGRYGPVAVIDLDRALGIGDNRDVVRACCRVAECRVGGGIRSEDDVRDWIRAGADKVLIGTMATPEFLSRLPREWLIACVDSRGDEVVVRGWTEGTGRNVVDQARQLAPHCAELLFTQVQVEGMLAGPDLETASALRQVVEIPITVAGGIRSADDLRQLVDAGFNGQVGRAYYEGLLDLAAAWTSAVAFDERGRVPTVVTDADSGKLLMLAYSTRESLTRALTEGRGWYYSRSRDELWRKGETSGNTQALVAARWDCDRDTVHFRVRQSGPACHRGVTSCFSDPTGSPLGALERKLADRIASGDPGSYTRKLVGDPQLLASKLREETEEIIDSPDRANLVWECADLLYHLMARMQASEISLSEVENELRSRF